MLLTINSNQSLAEAKAQLSVDFDKHHWLQVTIVAGSRTHKMNNWIYQCYKMLANQNQEKTTYNVKCHCKYTIGMPILMELFPDERDYTIQMLKNVSHENKMRFIHNWPVTSRFTVKACAQYIDNIQEHYGNDYEYPHKDWRD